MDRLEPSDPRNVGPFDTVARLGAGGMGVVYLAQQGAERVALKVVASKLLGDASARTRFLREAQTLRLIKSPFVAQIVASSDDFDFPWIAVEFVSGPSMKELVEAQGPLGAEAWWATALALTSAIRETHLHGVTHRDVKPANVLSSESGPKLIDFGIALGVDDTSVTATGVLAGSPAWLSPEQFDGDDASSASDMFSLGSLLVFLGTGKSPWGDTSRATSATLMKSIIAGEPQVDMLENAQQAMVGTLLSKNPDDRLSADKFFAALMASSPKGALQRYEAWVAMQPPQMTKVDRAREKPRSQVAIPEAKVSAKSGVSELLAPPSTTRVTRRNIVAGLAAAAGLVAALSLFVVSVFTPEQQQEQDLVAEPAPLLELNIGDCVMDAAVPLSSDLEGLSTVPCDEPHDSELFSIVLAQGDNYPGPVALVELGQNQCMKRFGDFVGIDFGSSALDFHFYYPTLSSWGQGDRIVYCMVSDPGRTVVGSLQGVGR